MTSRQTGRVTSRLILSAACLVLVFGAGLVSAQCEPGEFCDRDEDGFFRDHQRCRGCPGERDCDDSVYNEDNICDGGTSVVYTAELTAGAFVFREFESGNPVAMTMFPMSGGDELRSADPLYMERPFAGFCSASNESECREDSDCPSGETCVLVEELKELQDTWDNAFLEGCPRLGGVPDELFAHFDDWRILVGGSQVRLGLGDYGVTVGDQADWELWIQLRRDEDLDEPSLPGEFSLPWVFIWGKPVDKKGRKSDCEASWALLDTPSTLVITTAGE